MAFIPGQRVRSRATSGRVGVIVEVGVIHAGIQFYSVFWGGNGGTAIVTENDLELHVEAPSPTASLIQGKLHGYQEFQRIITYHRLHRDFPLRNNIYAFNASRTQFFPYQFKPLIKLLDSARHRLLICDEVGLGKTIESGLILVELRARQTLKTVLVVCPAGLREKWRMELRKRFGEDFKVLSAPDVKDFLDDYEERPDQVTLNGVVSYETLRHAGALERLEDMLPSLDLVIMDEAHHMRNFGVRTRRVGVALAAGAGALILLTATPVHLGDQNLFSLLNLLDEEDFPDLELARQRFAQNEPLVRAQRLLGSVPPEAGRARDALMEAARYPWFAQSPSVGRVADALTALAAVSPTDPELRTQTLAVQRELADLNLLSHIFTRTRKREVQVAVARRKAFAVEITFTAAERNFYDAVSTLVRARAAATEHSVIVQWQLNNIQRRASSSIHALAQLFRDQPLGQGLFGGDDDDLPEDMDGAVPDRALQSAILEVQRLVAAWDPSAPDSKYERIRGLLGQLAAERPDHKLVVFAFYRETLRYLDRRLRADGVAAVLLDGGVSPVDRPAIIERFRDDPSIHVLLSSRVGSEGLDFQFCDTLVNYDLPWNPMEVEQRIGRLDRIGQQSEVLRVYNLWTLDTIEERILRKLYERIGVFERSIGSLDAVLGDTIRLLEREATSRVLTAEEAQAEAERVAQVLERAAGETERLESETSRFIGADEYFAEEVAAIQANRRYVTGDQLLRFVADFLRAHAPGTRLRYDHETKVGTLIPDAVLQRFMRSRQNVGDLISLLAASAEGVTVTFDAQVAFERPYVEFINVLHPLVTAILESYTETVGERISAQHVMLQTTKVPPGLYIFVVYRLTVHGAKGRHTMEAVFLNEDLEEACTASEAEALLGEMVELGEDGSMTGARIEPAVAEEAVNKASAVFLDRREALRQQLEAENDAFVERRLSSLRQSFDKNISRLRERLSRARAGGKQEKYQRMLRGQLARQEGEKDSRLGALDALRALQVEHIEITAGLLEVSRV